MESDIFRNKEYVYEVYKARSFSKAAQNLYITQPCLSAIVKKVEKRIGSPLFDRSQIPIRLTECGREYIRCVEEILHVETNFTDYLGDVGVLRYGRVAVGSNQIFASFLLTSVIQKFSSQYPEVKVSLIEGSTATLEEMLFKGELDLMLDHCSLDSAAYDRTPYGEEHLLLALSDSLPVGGLLRSYQMSHGDILSGRHLLPETLPVPFELLAPLPFLYLREGSDIRARMDAACGQAGIRPRVVLELELQATAYIMACGGLGVTAVSDTLVTRTQAPSHTLYYRISPEIGTRRVYFYHRKTKVLPRALREFLSTSGEVCMAASDERS